LVKLAARDELRWAGRVVGAGVDGHPHEELLPGGGVVQVVSPGGVADAVDPWLLGHDPEHIRAVSRGGQAVVLQPIPRGGRAAADGGQVDTPDQARQGVGQHDHARGEQAAAVQPACLGGKLQHGFGAYRLAGVPLAQVEPVQVGLVRGERVGGVDVEDVRPGLDDAP